jgi:hypothetical protein
MRLMPARLTAYVPDRPAAVRWVRDSVCRIGRGPECGLRVEHVSVSRTHAELRCEDGRWTLRDLGSKNGSFVDGQSRPEAELGSPAWLRFGDVHCEFVLFDAQSEARAAQRWSERRAASQALSEGLARHTELPDLLGDTLRAVVQLADCERGFLLLRNAEGWRVGAAHGLDPAALRSREFLGSVGAVQRALSERSAVVLNDVGGDPALAARASVIAAGLRSLVALPLLLGDEVLALVYADNRQPGAAITQMDMELLDAFGERAAMWIAASRAAESIERLAANAPAWRDIEHAHALAP